MKLIKYEKILNSKTQIALFVGFFNLSKEMEQRMEVISHNTAN